MSKSKDLYFNDYVRVNADERGRIIRLSDLHLALPAVNVFDSPTRCFTVNEEWCKIILGAVSLLLELDCWQDAQDENYSGIQQILDFLEGIECPPAMIVEDVRVNGCNIEAYIDGAWVNKGSILPCITGITDPMQLQLDDHENRLDVAETDIQTIYLDVANHETRLDDVELSISQINLTLTDLQNQINALSGGSGATNMKITVIPLDFPTTVTVPSSFPFIDIPETTISHQFTMENAFIVCEFRASSTGSSAATSEFRLSVATQVISLVSTIALSTSDKSLQLQDVWTGLQGQTLNILLQGRNGTSPGRLPAPQTLQYYIVEWSNAQSNTVTFDTGGLAYTLPNLAGQVAVIGTGGNGGNCARKDNIQPNEYIIVRVDLGTSKTIESIDLDIFASEGDCRFKLAVDSVFQGAQYGANEINAWTSTLFPAGIFPIVGQIIDVYLYPYELGSAVSDLRIDNIKVVAT